METTAMQEARKQDPLWYQGDLPTITPSTRALFEIDHPVTDEELRRRLIFVREKAWEIFPYHCIGRWAFLDLRISSHPIYFEVLERTKGGQRLLDIGCGLGQDIRKLIADGANPANVFATDLRQGFIDLGFELFNDRSRLGKQIIAADFTDDTPKSPLFPLQGTFDLIHACSFFHVLSYEQQEKAVTHALELLKGLAGCTIFGSSPMMRLGEPRSVDPSQQVMGGGTGEVVGQRHKRDAEDFKKMWSDAGEKMGLSLDIKFEPKTANVHEGAIESQEQDITGPMMFVIRLL